MARLLLNLRNVPDEEADDVRAFLDANEIDFFETTPSRWGISNGGIWLKHEEDRVRARRLMDDYQAGLRARMRAQQAKAVQDGTAERFLDVVRAEPLRVLLAVLAIVGLLALVALPAWLLRQ